MNRRTFLKGLTATAAGILLPERVAAESDRRVLPGPPPPGFTEFRHSEVEWPKRRIWALDQTMIPESNVIVLDGLEYLVHAIREYHEQFTDEWAAGKVNRGDFDGWYRDQLRMSLHSSKITVGDYQADHAYFAERNGVLWASTTENDWYSRDHGMTWRPILSVLYDDAI